MLGIYVKDCFYLSQKNDGGLQRSSCGRVYDLLFLLQQDVSSLLWGEGGQPFCGGREPVPGVCTHGCRHFYYKLNLQPLILTTSISPIRGLHFIVVTYHCMLLTSSCYAWCFLLGRDVRQMVFPRDHLLGAVLAIGGLGNQDIVHKPERASGLWKALENF